MNEIDKLIAIYKEIEVPNFINEIDFFSLKFISEIITKAAKDGYYKFEIVRNHKTEIESINEGFKLIKFEVQILAKKKHE